MADEKKRLKADIKAEQARRNVAANKTARRLVSSVNSEVGKLINRLRKAGSFRDAAQILGGIEADVLGRLMRTLPGDLKDLFDKEIAAAKATLAITTGAKIPTEPEEIKLLVKRETERIRTQIATQLNRYASDTASAYIVGIEPDLDSISARLGDSLASKLSDELELKLAGYNQALIVKGGDDADLGLWWYLGPDDQITRDFCADLLTDRDPAVYTRDEIEAMDNGQGLPVLVYCGGYNCRHTWRPISEEFAKELGWKPGKD